MLHSVHLFAFAGFAKNNKRTERGTSKHQVCFVLLQLRSADQRTIIWKNPKPNSNRTTRILRSIWTTETSDFIVETHNNVQEEINQLSPFHMEIDNVVLKVNFMVKNCMNDGKVVHALATEHFKKEKLIPIDAKSLSFHTCHICGRNQKEFSSHFHVKKESFSELMSLGFAPMHCAKNSRECILKAAFRKHSAKKLGSQDSKSVKRAQDIICKRLQFATGARLFEPEPAKKGNSNTGVNLKTITQMAEKSAEILDCSQELLESLHELLGRIESLKPQDPVVLKNLSERIFHLFQTDFGEFSKMSPSFHRAISHSEEFAQYYQKEGFTIGEMSETAQEAINCPTKKDVAFFSFRGSHKSQNLQCFQRNWAFADPFTMEFAE